MNDCRYLKLNVKCICRDILHLINYYAIVSSNKYEESNWLFDVLTLTFRPQMVTWKPKQCVSSEGKIYHNPWRCWPIVITVRFLHNFNVNYDEWLVSQTQVNHLQIWPLRCSKLNLLRSRVIWDGHFYNRGPVQRDYCKTFVYFLQGMNAIDEGHIGWGHLCVWIKFFGWLPRPRPSSKIERN